MNPGIGQFQRWRRNNLQERTAARRFVFVRHSLIGIAVIGMLLFGCVTRPMPTPSRSALVSYSSPSRESLERLTIRRTTLDNSARARIATLLRTNSPWGSRWLASQAPDYMHEGPWTTRLYVFSEVDGHECIEIEARDHNNCGVHYQWLNDRALFVQCWWGRIVSTDFVLDAETARPVYIQDANYWRLIQPPER